MQGFNVIQPQIRKWHCAKKLISHNTYGWIKWQWNQMKKRWSVRKIVWMLVLDGNRWLRIYLDEAYIYIWNLFAKRLYRLARYSQIRTWYILRLSVIQHAPEQNDVAWSSLPRDRILETPNFFRHPFPTWLKVRPRWYFRPEIMVSMILTLTSLPPIRCWSSRHFSATSAQNDLRSTVGESSRHSITVSWSKRRLRQRFANSSISHPGRWKPSPKVPLRPWIAKLHRFFFREFGMAKVLWQR